MAISVGDKITASALNTANSVAWSYSSGHLNSNGKQPYYFCFYCNRPSNDTIGDGECRCGWFANCKIELFRYESGTWTQKDQVYNNGGMYINNQKLTFKSYGYGSYYIYMSNSNYAHHRYVNNFVNQRVSNVKGNELKYVDPSVTVYANNSNPVLINGYNTFEGQKILAADINDRYCYA